MYKDKKMIRIVSEQIKSPENKYLIGTTSEELAKEIYFYRSRFSTYIVLPTNSYIISNEQGSNYLTITNDNINTVIESFQICYEESYKSGVYNEDGIANDDIVTLRENYNRLQKDFVNLWELVRTTLIKSDTLAMELNLPNLQAGDVWVKTEDGWKGKDADTLFPIDPDDKLIWLENLVTKRYSNSFNLAPYETKVIDLEEIESGFYFLTLLRTESQFTDGTTELGLYPSYNLSFTNNIDESKLVEIGFIEQSFKTINPLSFDIPSELSLELSNLSNHPIKVDINLDLIRVSKSVNYR